jgi:drug/metabolite transporter (DMT)-like permease
MFTVDDPTFPKSVLTLFGYFGLVACMIGFPLVILLNVIGLESLSVPSSALAWLGVIGNALVGSVLSDVLLAKSVLLLNPVTVAIGLSMSMPLSLLLDSVAIRSSCLVAILLQFSAVCLISYDNHKQNRI